MSAPPKIRMTADEFLAGERKGSDRIETRVLSTRTLTLDSSGISLAVEDIFDARKPASPYH